MNNNRILGHFLYSKYKQMVSEADIRMLRWVCGVTIDGKIIN